MRVFSVDLGAETTGWGYLEDGMLLDCGAWHLTRPKRIESHGMRWVRFDLLLEAFADDHDINLVSFEEVRRHKGTSAAHAYGGARAFLLAWCERRKLEYLSVPVSAGKKIALGKGGGKGADKAAVLAAARGRWPDHIFETNDVSDAAFVGLATFNNLLKK